VSDVRTPHYRITDFVGRYATVFIDVEPGTVITLTMLPDQVHTPAGDVLVRTAVDGWRATRAAVMDGEAF
jgi:hypothetical protein